MKRVTIGCAKENSNALEQKLLQRVSDGDRLAFDDLFANYYPRLFAFLFRMTRSHGSAEELANDVMYTLWKDAGNFRGASKVSTWIFGIAYRQSLALLKKRKLTVVPFVDDVSSGHDTDRQLENEDWVRHGLELLPPKQKLTVMLVYFLGLSCEETANVSGVPVSTVKTRMFNARKNMKVHLVAGGVPQDWNKDSVDD